jgi:tetratricopeptide (TPR) repeat protein
VHPGETIAERFEIETLAGTGGMGAVYRAIDRRTGARVALKIMLAGGDLERFDREATLLADVRHRRIVAHVAHGRLDGARAFLAMEWLEGEDLAARLARGTLSVEETIEVARGAAEALVALHVRGLVHRDVKPSNLFLVGRSVDDVRLLDLGVARDLAGTKLTQTGAVIGTPSYMAPEQVRGESTNAAADVFSLACVTFECLTGRPPFVGEHVIAVLAKLVMETPPQLSSLCADAPPWLASLVDRMLSKAATARPADARAVLLALDAARAPTSRMGGREALGLTEQRVVAILIGGLAAAEDETLARGKLDQLRSDAQSIVVARGGEMQMLADGALLAAFRGASSPVDAASDAVRCALELARRVGPIAVATGRAVVDRGGAVGEVIDRAADLASRARDRPRSTIVVDDATRALLEGRFEIERSGDEARILGEKSVFQVGGRKLLGRPTRCVGRDREMASLAASLDEVKDEPVARAVMLTAPAGTGKSRLASEAVRAARDRGFEVLAARAEPGGAFALASRVLMAAAASDDPSEASFVVAMRARLARLGAPDGMLEWLAEIAGHPFSDADAGPALRAARLDAMTMGDALRTAWDDWLALECARRPTLLLLDDVHWADLPTMKLVDGTLRRIASKPLMVLATARPEVHEVFPRLWAERDVAEIRLAPLTPRAAERMAREVLGTDAAEETVRKIVERSGGHPFFLEELIRSVSEGDAKGAMPDTVLGVLQSRLDALGSDAKRVLRAASVFGQTFWTGAVGALVAEPSDAIEGRLTDLASKEIVERATRTDVHGETAWTFRHPLVRDAAYAMLTADDRSLAHRLCGEWLESHAAGDALTLATHFDRGDAPHRALPWFHRAAEHALDAGDFAAATAHAESALAHDPDDRTRGALRSVVSEARFWTSDLVAGESIALEAASDLEHGSAAWFSALATACACAGQRGDNARADELARRTIDVPASGNAASAKAICLARAACQLVYGTRERAQPLLDELDRLRASGDLDALALAWAFRSVSEAALVEGTIHTAIAVYREAVGRFEAANAMRLACLMRMVIGACWAMAGEPALAIEETSIGLEIADRLGSSFLRGFGLVELVLAHAQTPDADRVVTVAHEAIPLVAGHTRLTMIVLVSTVLVLVRVGDLERARAFVQRLEALDASGILRGMQLGSLALFLVHDGAIERALLVAREAAEVDRKNPGFDLYLGTPQLALAEVLERTGDRDGAIAALREGIARILSYPEMIATPERRRAYLSRACVHATLLAHARRLGIDPPELS